MRILEGWMAKPITVAPLLELEEVERRMRTAPSGLEHAHWQVIWLAMRGKPSKEIVEFTGYGRDSESSPHSSSPRTSLKMSCS